MSGPDETREAAPGRTASSQQETAPSRHRKSQNSKDRSETTELPLPHDIDAEAALLGVALLAADALEVLATKVVPGDFYKPAHQVIASALGDAYTSGYPADNVTIAATISQRGQIDSIGGPNTLITLIADAPSTANAARYAQIIHDHATRRRIHAAAKALTETVHGDSDAHALVEQAQAAMASVAAQNGSRTYSSLDMPDMELLISGGLEIVEPDFLTRQDGQSLIYAGKINSLVAEPGSGKSWIALFAAMEVMELGGTVIYLDYEDSARGIAGRLLTLGADPKIVAEQFQWVKPTGAMGHSERAEMQSLFSRLKPNLVILDGVGEALSREGLDENSNTDVLTWTNGHIRWMSNAGAAVVLIDHVVKDKEKSGRYARGASAKLSAPDGVTYVVRVNEPFSRHKPGAVSLVVAKDRPGSMVTGETVAAIHFDPGANGETLRWQIVKPERKREYEEDPFRPTRIMEFVSRELERAHETKANWTSKLLADVCSSKIRKNLIVTAIGRLLAEGYFTTHRLGSVEYLRLVKPYRDGSTPPEAEHIQQTFGGRFEPPMDELAKRRTNKKRNNHDDNPNNLDS